MIPILYKADETEFKTYGIGALSDIITCSVTEERNSTYECVFTYPITGAFYSEIKNERIIKAKPNDTSENQAFRIYRITKPLKGIVKVYAQHLSYDLNGIAAALWTGGTYTPQLAIEHVFNNALTEHNFTFTTDYTEAKEFSVDKPKSLRAVLGGEEGSLISLWGGEFEWDNYKVIHHQGRGNNNGVVIEYGKNLTKLEHDLDISEVYTHLFPYATYTDEDGNETLVTLTEQLLTISDTTLVQPKTLIKDFSDSFEYGTEITEDALREKAQNYIDNNSLGSESPSVTISFEALWKQPEYPAVLERVSLCDTVTVKYTDLGVSVKSKVIKTVYDTLAEKYTSITLGSAKSSLITTLTEAQSSTEKASAKTDTLSAIMTAAINNSSKQITGQTGGYVVLHGDDTGQPYELLILDTPNIDDAVNVWRWNSGGLGFSSNGYNGPYETAITADGQIVADFIATGTLAANLIKAGTISSADGSSYWNIETGEIVINNYATSSELDAVSETVTELGLSAQGMESRMSTAEGNISSISQSVNEISTRVSDNESNISVLQQTSDALSAQVSGKADESYGSETSSFGWSLTSSGFYLYSDSSTVMSVTSTGLTLSGTIYAVSGKIGGINLADYGLYTVDPEDETTVNLGISTDGYIYLTESGYILFQGKFTSSLTKETVQLMSYTSTATTGWNYTYVTQSDSATDLLIDTSNGITFTPTAVYSSNVETMGLGKDVSTGFTSSFANDGIKLGYKYYESSSLNGTLTALDIYTEYYYWYYKGASTLGSSYDPYVWGVGYISAPYDLVLWAGATDSSAAGYLYGTWYLGSDVLTASDESLKNSIETLPDKYGDLFDNLNPVRFKYNDGTSGRYHTGFVAQEVAEAMEKAGVETSEFAAYAKNQKKKGGETVCSLRYSEIIALCVDEIQKLKKRVKALEEEKK